MSIVLRPAKPEDLPEITTIFRETIQTVNAKDYSPEQTKVWSSGAAHAEKWLERIKTHYFLVAEEKHTITGWAYLSNGNYFDGLYIHKAHQGKGIASLFLYHFEAKAKGEGYTNIHSDVSITALPFFKKHGYTVIKKQQKKVKAVVFENFIVEKTLV